MFKIIMTLEDAIFIALFALLMILYFGILLGSIVKMNIKNAIDKFKRERKANERTEDRVN